MKIPLISALKTKFEGVSDAILGRVADKLIASGKVKSEADIATAVEGVTFQQILESYGDSRADEAQKTAVKNYESKYKIKDGKPVEEPAKQPEVTQTTQPGGTTTTTQPQNQPDEISALLKTILEQNKTMAAELATIKQEKTASSRQSQLAEILKDAPQTVRTRYEKDFARMTFKDDEDFAGWLGEITPDIQQINTDFASKGGVVNRPKGGTGSGTKQNEVNPYLQARAEGRKAETSSPAIQGLAAPTN